MQQPPPQLVQWLKQRYPKPIVDEHWLSQCYDWVIEADNLNPATDMDTIKENVESQLLMSDLTDSMVHGTGLPHDIASFRKSTLSGPPVLVQILALMEIGHSAFNLMNVNQTRKDKADLSGLVQGDNEDEADEGPIPNYPRSMLQFELSDGAITLKAIEYRKIPQLDLEKTPLGFKIQLKNVTIRQGIAFLEPRNIVLKGNSVDDLEVHHDRNFLRGLRLRLDPHAQHDSEGDGGDEREGHGREVQALPAPAPAPAPARAPAPIVRNTPAPMPTDMPNARRAAPTYVNTTARGDPPPVPGPSSGTVQLPPPSTDNSQPLQPRPLARLSRQTGPSAPPTNHVGAPTTSPHFSTPGTTMVAPMRLSPTRATTEPLADEPSEPGSDWYFGHDGIDASFISRAASELERTEAQLSQSSQPSLSQPSQPPREVIFVDDENNDKENILTGRGVVRRTLQRQVQICGSLIDLSAEIVEGPRVQHRPMDDDDVISIGSND